MAGVFGGQVGIRYTDDAAAIKRNFGMLYELISDKAFEATRIVTDSWAELDDTMNGGTWENTSVFIYNQGNNTVKVRLDETTHQIEIPADGFAFFYVAADMVPEVACAAGLTSNIRYVIAI